MRSCLLQSLLDETVEDPCDVSHLSDGDGSEPIGAYSSGFFFVVHHIVGGDAMMRPLYYSVTDRWLCLFVVGGGIGVVS